METTANVNPAELLKYISPSRLNLWSRCPRAFALRYVHGVITPSNKNLLLGTVVHRGLEFVYRYRRRGITLFPEFVAKYIRRIWQSAVDDEGLHFTPGESLELQTQAVGLVTCYLELDGLKHEQPVAIESRLEAPLIDPLTGENLGIPLVGIVDLVLDDNGRPLIVDFKTAARCSSNTSVMHEIQLTAYSYLIRQLTKQTESGIEIRSLIKTKTPKVQIERFEPRRDEHFARLFDVIRAYLDAIRNETYHISPGFACNFCDFRDSACMGEQKAA